MQINANVLKNNVNIILYKLFLLIFKYTLEATKHTICQSGAVSLMPTFWSTD